MSWFDGSIRVYPVESFAHNIMYRHIYYMRPPIVNARKTS